MDSVQPSKTATTTTTTTKLTAWEQFIGPGATTAENVLILGVGVLSTVGVLVYQILIVPDQTKWQVGVGALLAFDVFGGVVANGTVTTRRWYHRAGQTKLDHIGFISLHLLHMLLVAAAFGGDWGPWVVYAVLLLVSAIQLEYTPRYLKNPVAMTWYMLVFVVWLAYPAPARNAAPGLEWIIPMLFLKLILGHAIPANPVEDYPYEAIDEH